VKSRKPGFLNFGNRKTRHQAKGSRRSTVRLRIIESLEKRELMASDWNPAIAAVTGDFPTEAARQTVIDYITSQADGSGGGGSGAGSSGEASLTNVSEVEPNNAARFAQNLSLTPNTWVVVTGTNPTLDVDWFAANLRGGDILNVDVVGSVLGQGVLSELMLTDASGNELISMIGQPFEAYPPESPLSQATLLGPNNPFTTSLHYIVPKDGKYLFRLSDVGGNYSATFKAFRSVYEAQPIGTHQTLLLDFDGETVRNEDYGFGPGSLKMAPLSRFVTQFGLSVAETPLFIREITRRTQAKFDQLAIDTNNPNFRISVKNTLDDGDLWGLPFVSRVIVGDVLVVTNPIIPALFGIAESIDPGNFATEETSLVFASNFAAFVPTVPISATATTLQLASEMIARTTAHEAGHMFGIWHQTGAIETAGNVGIMTAGPLATTANRAGTGPDGVFGTIDDTPSRFTNDDFQGNGFIIEGGQDDSVNWLGWALTTGQVGGSIQGTAFLDRNLNRSLDSGDLRLENVFVYADLDNDSQFDAGEFATRSGADGSYNLRVPGGATYTIRTTIPTGLRPVAPLGNAYSVSVPTATTNVTGRNFGYEQILQSATGRKWNDVNGNGLRDNGEPGVGGVKIYYDLDGDGRLDIGEPRTDSLPDGTYVLPAMPAGTYSIREVIEPGWVQLFPGTSTGFAHTVTLTGDLADDATRLVGLDFGNQLLADYGDAPASYGAASAGFVDGLRLGALWDSEGSSTFSVAADGDDLAGSDDEDGVRPGAPLVRGLSTNTFVVNKVNTSGQNAFLNAWLDLDRDGLFEDSEKIANPETGFLIPSTTALGPIFARFRYGTQANVGPTGYTTGGEVEDYQFFIASSQNIAVDDFDTVPRNGTKVINVLANDFRSSSSDILTVVSTSGTSVAGGNVIRALDGSNVTYSAPTGFIGRDSFQYTVRNSQGQTSIATVVIDVSLFFQDPFAVDDTFDLPTNTIDFPLNVLSNDIEGQGGALTITSIVQPDKGGFASIAAGGKSLRYTPQRNFGGTEFLTYTAIDASGDTTSATVTLHTLEGDRNDDQVQIRLEAVSLDTPSSTLNPQRLSQIVQGDDFKIRVYVDDLRHDSNNPGSASGVFAAYFDLLYNMQLVSTKPVNNPASRFNFEVNFVNDFADFTRGDGAIPGLINEFGATSRNINLQMPNEVLMAEIIFTARSPGVVSFGADPANSFPDSDTLLFNVPGSSVPLERIRYLGTQIEVFGSGATFPVAVDDSTRVLARDSVDNEINVLQNDSPGSVGGIRIVSVTQPARGTAAIDTKVPGNNEDDVVTYTPSTGFVGFDQFTYTIQDSRGVQATATVTVHVGNTPGDLNPDSDDIVSFELVVTNLSGTPVTELTVGDSFQLRAFVKDLRTTSPNSQRETRGVFAAYQDVLFNQNLVSPVLSSTNDPNLGFTVAFGPLYNRVREGDVRNRFVINEIGAIATNDTPASYEDRRLPLFTATLKADRTGIAQFFSDPSDIIPLHEVLTFDPVQRVTPDKIHFGFASVNIVSASGGSGEFHNSSNPEDVNGDGFVSPIDALLIINKLNSGGVGPLGNGNGEGETGGSFYPDTNNDGFLSPIDALGVINKLNLPKGSGEGESSLASPEVRSSDGELVGEGEGDSSAELTPSILQPLYGPMTPAHYAAFVDSLFGADDEDEEDSELEDLATDIDLNWKKGLLG
jgi:large repetitive protein